MVSKLQGQGYQWLPMPEAWEAVPDLGKADEINRRFKGYEGLWCRYIFANTYFQQLHDTVLLTHGPLSCVAAMKNFKQTQYCLFWAEPYSYSPSTNLDESTLVMGGEDDLTDVLKRVDQEYRPRLIIITDTCATMMIGDDVASAIERVRGEVKAKVVYTPSSGFTAVLAGRAMELTSAQSALFMDPPASIRADAVNVLGTYTDSGLTPKEGRKYCGDLPAFQHLIEGIGLKVHRILNHGDYDYIRTAPEAAVNTINTPSWGYALAREMEKRFGTPWMRMALPMGPGAIRRWVMELANHMGREEEAEQFLRVEEERLAPLFDRVRKEVEGRAMLMECSRNSMAALAHSVAYARLGAELGMEPYLFNIHPLEFKSSKDDVDCFLMDQFRPKVLIGPYTYGQPVNVPDVMEDLGLDADHCLYCYEDVFPYARSGTFDPCQVPRYTSSVQMKRVKGAPHRGLGYAGTAATYRGILEAIDVSRKRSQPTFFGRVWSRTPFEFQYAAPEPPSA